MNILLLTQVFPPQTGGSGRWLWELYRRLDGVDVHVATADTAGDAAFDARSGMAIERMPLRFSTWGVCNPRGVFQYARAFRRVRSIVARVRPDVIHCGKCLPEGLLARSVGRRSGIPYWCYAHGEELTLARTSRELRRLTGFVLRGAEMVVANSRFTERLLTGEWGLPPARVTVMHPGVDTSRFTPAARNDEARRELGWNDRRVILTVGALQKRKGQDMLIRALPAIRKSCPDVLYAIAGEGWEREDLERLVVEHRVSDLVQFRGAPNDDELVQCYQQCDLFVLPNRRIGWDVEGFGMVLVEAQASGKPVIAGNSGGTTDTLQAGVTGELVDATSPDTLAAAAVRLLADRERAQAMGGQAREWAVEQFEWRHQAAHAVRLFEAHQASGRTVRSIQPA